MIDRQDFPEISRPFLGAPREKLRRGLQSAFQNYPALNRFAQEVLGVNLNEWTSDTAGLAANIDALMTQMDQEGKVMQLVESARAERPSNAALREVEEFLSLTFNPYDDVQETAGLKSQLSRSGVENIIVAAAGFASADDFVAKLGEAEFRVCYITYGVPGGAKAYGTGFLIGIDLVMTNAHVIEYACTPKIPFILSGDAIEVGFDFRTPTSLIERCTLATSGWLVASDPDVKLDGSRGLDYAILRLASKMGDAPLGATSGAAKRGYFRTEVHDPDKREPLLILQHPFDAMAGQPSPMRLTIGFVTGTDETDIRHTANTLRGSSGAPIFNANCEVIGVHYWGDETFNAAKKMEAIMQDLKAKGLADLLA
jgi:hypothetical protein